jgi:hypothetical protein
MVWGVPVDASQVVIGSFLVALVLVQYFDPGEVRRGGLEQEHSMDVDVNSPEPSSWLFSSWYLCALVLLYLVHCRTPISNPVMPWVSDIKVPQR